MDILDLLRSKFFPFIAIESFVSKFDSINGLDLVVVIESVEYFSNDNI